MNNAQSSEYYTYQEKKGDKTLQNEIWKLELDKEKEASYIDATWDQKTVSVSFQVPLPVYKEIIDGEEQIVYNSREMKIDHLYQIEFNGEHWGLRKTKTEVEFLKAEL